MPTFSHIYIDSNLSIAEVVDVILMVTFYMWFFFPWIPDGIFLLGKWLTHYWNFCMKKNDNTLLVYLIEKTDYSILGFFFG